MNFADAPTIRNPREFLAVILAGFGAEYVLRITPNFLLILCKVTATDEQLWRSTLSESALANMQQAYPLLCAELG